MRKVVQKNGSSAGILEDFYYLSDTVVGIGSLAYPDVGVLLHLLNQLIHLLGWLNRNMKKLEVDQSAAQR